MGKYYCLIVVSLLLGVSVMEGSQRGHAVVARDSSDLRVDSVDGDGFNRPRSPVVPEVGVVVRVAPAADTAVPVADNESAGSIRTVSSVPSEQEGARSSYWCGSKKKDAACLCACGGLSAVLIAVGVTLVVMLHPGTSGTPADVHNNRTNVSVAERSRK